MDKLERTVKLQALADGAKQVDQVDAKDILLELSHREAQLQEEKSRSIENLKKITQLRESLKQEQEKTAGLTRKIAELENSLKDTAASKANDEALANLRLQLETEEKKSLEQSEKIERQRESLKREQARTDEMANRVAALESRLKERDDLQAQLDALQARVKDMAGALGQISDIANAARAE